MHSRTTAQAEVDLTACVWYVRPMQLDYYDEELPEPYMTLAESYSKNKESIKSVAKIVGTPILAFALTCVFNYYVKKKMESL